MSQYMYINNDTNCCKLNFSIIGTLLVHCQPMSSLVKEIMSLEDILSKKPSPQELCEHVNIGTKWYTFGVLLGLDTTKLDSIRRMNEDSSFKAIKMFELWLSSNPNATRNQVINTLKKEPIGEMSVAKSYMSTLREHFNNIGE